jgi:hypothetical protein
MSPSKKDKINPEAEIMPAAPVEPIVPEMVPPPLPPVSPLPPMPTSSSKPGKVQTVAILTLVSGISNIIWMISVAIGILVFGVSTLGLGCLLIPLVIPPIVLGVFEIIYSVKLLANPPKMFKLSQTIAILQIICILTGNIIPLVAGILALVFDNDAEVKSYFAQLTNQF